MFVTTKTLEQLEVIFQKLTIRMLGYTQEQMDLYDAYISARETGSPVWTDPVPFNPYYYVRLPYPYDGAPAWKKAEDVVFVEVKEVDGYYNKERELDEETYNPSPESITQKMRFTRILQVFWSCWGDNSFVNAEKIRDGMYIQEFADVLSREKIYFIPDITAPIRAPELFEGGWWKRYDLKILFNTFVEKEREIEVIKSAELVVENYQGQVAEINVEEN